MSGQMSGSVPRKRRGPAGAIAAAVEKQVLAGLVSADPQGGVGAKVAPL